MTAPDHMVEPLKTFLREWGHPYMALRDKVDIVKGFGCRRVVI
jgi:hypothetical protein